MCTEIFTGYIHVCTLYSLYRVHVGVLQSVCQRHVTGPWFLLGPSLVSSLHNSQVVTLFFFCPYSLVFNLCLTKQKREGIEPNSTYILEPSNIYQFFRAANVVLCFNPSVDAWSNMVHAVGTGTDCSSGN